MARRNAKNAVKTVDPEHVDAALAKAICDGDIVNFRLLFAPFSPARVDSPEEFTSPKYAYLLPDEDLRGQHDYRETLRAVQDKTVRAHINEQLEARRPAQLPASLVQHLADHAVRAGKYTSAAQAYELLRIRRRMQEAFFAAGEAALDEGDVSRAVRGFRIATGLEYDYAAYPEPLPAVPDFQTRALILHGEYPRDPAASVALQPPETHVHTTLSYLMRSGPAAARLEERPIETRVAFVAEWVHQSDPDWPAFARRYQDACAMVEASAERFERAAAQGRQAVDNLRDEIDQTLGEDPREIPACLLGRPLPDGEWWQYLKELAYTHPASVLFISRLALGDFEVLVPRLLVDSPLPHALGLVPPQEES